MKTRLLQRLPWFVPLLLALTPAIVVLADVLSYDGATPLVDFARETLLSAVGLRSFVAALGAGAIATALGLAPGVLLASRPRGWRLVLCAAWLAGLALPTVFIAGAFSHVLELGPAPPRSDEAAFGRWAALSLAWGVSFAPLASLVVALVLARVPRAEVAAAEVFLPAAQRWRIVLVPRLRGGLALAAAAAAALAFTDAGGPAHFGVQSVASRAAFEFQSTLETAPAGVVVIPPWLLAAALVGLLASRQAGRGREGARVHAGRGVLGLTGFGLLVGVVAPMISLAIVAGAALLPAELVVHKPEIVNSLKYSLAGGVAAAAAALALLALDASASRGQRMPAAAAALALLAPGMAVGYTALLAAIRLPGPQDLWWWLGFLMLRCAPWCLPLIAFGAGSSRAPLALGLPPLTRMRAALLERGPLLACAAMVAGAAAGLREFEYFAAFSLPGGESLAARCAQMLHFGMRPALAAQMLVQMVIALCWSMLALALWRRRD